MLEFLVLGLCVVSFIISLVGLKNNGNSKGKKNELKMEIIEKTNEVLIKNYNSISNKYDNLSSDFKELMESNKNLNKKYDILNKDFKILSEKTEKLEKKNIKLERDIKYLEDENLKIHKTLEHYNIMAPNFKLDKAFTMKVVK